MYCCRNSLKCFSSWKYHKLRRIMTKCISNCYCWRYIHVYSIPYPLFSLVDCRCIWDVKCMGSAVSQAAKEIRSKFWFCDYAYTMLIHNQGGFNNSEILLALDLRFTSRGEQQLKLLPLHQDIWLALGNKAKAYKHIAGLLILTVFQTLPAVLG